MNYAEQIAACTADAVIADRNVVVMGAGVTDNKGIFGTTRKACDVRPCQVIETPLSETMLTGALVGLAQNGKKPIFVHARSDFMTLSAEHLVNTIAKWRYMGGGELPIMVRCIIGQGWGNGPQHTQSFAHWFASVPGLRVFTPHSRDGIQAAFQSWHDGNPTVVFEHRALYGTDYSQDIRGLHCDVILAGLSGAMPELFRALDLLSTEDIHADIDGLEQWPQQSWGAWDIHTPIVAVDIAPHAPFFGNLFAGKNTSVLSPPDYPCPASYPLEAAWYPSAEKIANAALRLLGKKPVFDESVNVVAVPTGGGPF